MLSEFRKANRLQLKGREIFEIQPVILGGSPTDPDNKTALTRQEHIQAVNYWNHYIKQLRKNQANDEAGHRQQ
ncbi:hypothetical protein FYK55_11890 [Roseiconus nitratireducens]|uniref:Uncharacterized protein n=1 Tax=Roseiconus nitratireducens TaxID=2605748 RepID=A0A5M6D931_9BACT|nr:hypothetical protein [Roseiconus nitratireducens]KAA5543863.1 hypothetical protein FYK55_11890 [Roseiconus nitratireducens]